MSDGEPLTRERILGALLMQRIPGSDAAARMNPMQPPRCGARTRKGGFCRAWPVRGRRRCRLHGGMSTGPRTAEGLERSRRARWKHGHYSREALEARARERAMRPSTLEERQATMRRWAREDRRAARKGLAAMRRLFGPG